MYDFFMSYIVITCDNYFRIVVNFSLNINYVTIRYNAHTCNHAACPHFHHPLWDTFVISF